MDLRLLIATLGGMLFVALLLLAQWVWRGGQLWARSVRELQAVLAVGPVTTTVLAIGLFLWGRKPRDH